MTIFVANCLSIIMTVVLGVYWQNQYALQNAVLNGTYTSFLTNGTKISFHGYSEYVPAMNEYIPIPSAEMLDENEVNVVFGIFIIFIIFTILLLLISIAMRRRVNLAIAILQETCKIFAKMPTIFLSPIFPMIFICLLLVYFIWIMIYLMCPMDQAVITIVGRSWTSPSIIFYNHRY